MKKGGGWLIKPYQDEELMYQKIVVEDKSYSQVAKELNCSYNAVRNNSIKFGFGRQFKWKEIKKQHGDYIAEAYNSNKTLKEISEVLNCEYSTVKLVLESYGIEIRSRSEVKQLIDESQGGGHRKYDVNHDYFKTWSSDMAYIVGFINADGTLRKNGENGYGALSISQKRESKEILEKVKNEMEYEGEVIDLMAKIGDKEYPTSQLVITSKTILDDLNDIGIVSNKSLIKEFPSVPEEYEIDYIRGYFDGNGSIGAQYPTNSKGIRTNVCQIRVRICSGSEKHLDKMQGILQKYGLKEKKVTHTKENLYEILYSTKESSRLYELFYENPSSMRMERKQQRFEECLLQREEDLKQRGEN